MVVVVKVREEVVRPAVIEVRLLLQVQTGTTHRWEGLRAACEGMGVQGCAMATMQAMTDWAMRRTEANAGGGGTRRSMEVFTRGVVRWP